MFGRQGVPISGNNERGMTDAKIGYSKISGHLNGPSIPLITQLRFMCIDNKQAF